MINTICSFLLCILGYVLYQKYARRKLPPGPLPLPILGNLVQIFLAGGYPFESLHRLAKQYGNVFSLMIGIVPTVIVSEHEGIRHILKSEDFDDHRFEAKWILDRVYGKPLGLIFSAGNCWKDSRRVSMRILREFGFGKKTNMETLILDEIEDLISRFKTSIAKDDVVLIHEQFYGPMANVVWSLVTGARFDLEGAEFKGVVAALNDIVRAGQLGGVNLLGAYPFLYKYLPNLTGFARIQNGTDSILNYIEGLIKTHRARGDYKMTPNNFIDQFLSEIDSNTNPDSEVYTDKNLACILNDLLQGGTETSANSIMFAVRYMVQYPEVQRNVREEIQRVIGCNRMVNTDDKPKLRYTDATVLEIMRCSHVAPAAPRFALKDYQLGPYIIPKGTSVIVSFYSANMEDGVWGDPRNFRPERFIGEDETTIINAEKILVFGAGKRNCIGEVTARSSLFIALSNLVRSFVIEPDQKSGMPGPELRVGLTVAPVPFKIRMTPVVHQG